MNKIERKKKNAGMKKLLVAVVASGSLESEMGPLLNFSNSSNRATLLPLSTLLFSKHCIFGTQLNKLSK